MLTLQEIADIAARHDTAVARAMLVACLVRHYETGEPLSVTLAPPEGAPVGRIKASGDTGAATLALGEWERIVRGNSDTRWQHV